ncbi:MAG: fibronectin type III domain-containing protein, partial [Ruminococcus sp.]|nr:fibronectin type III domain-containing protein [Ruminococcus sp.]
ATAGSKKATLKWSKSTGATGYIAYIKSSANASWQRMTTTKATSFTKTGLTSGKTYYFTVKAYRTDGSKTYNASFKTISVKIK